MNKIILFCLIFFSSNIIIAQEIDLLVLIRNCKNDSEGFQKILSSQDYKLFKTNKNINLKTDSISFINKNNIEIGLVKSRKNNSFYIANVNENYFKAIVHDLNSDYFKLISTDINNNNSIIKIYVNFEFECEIHVTTFGIKSRDEFLNEYEIKVEFVKNFKSKYRKELKEYSNKSLLN